MRPLPDSPDLQLARELVARHLNAAQATVTLFGSRARGDARRWSDIDLAVAPKGELPPGLLAEMREAFEESNMLLNVDLVVLRESNSALREAVAREGVQWIA